MLTKRLIKAVPKVLKRNIGIAAPALQTAQDPIQQLFLEKLREYKSKNAGGKLLEGSPEIVKERKAELDRIAQQFGGASSAQMSEFPKFNFTDPPVETTFIKK